MEQGTNNFVIFMTLALVLTVLAIGLVGFFILQKILRRAKNIERSLKIVPLILKLPPAAVDSDQGRDSRQLSDENIAQAEGVFNLLAGVNQGSAAWLYGRKHLSLEIVARSSQLYFYLGVPISLLTAVEKALVAGYPNIQVQRARDHNIFSSVAKITGVAGGEFTLTETSFYPLNDYKKSDFDGLAGILSGLSKLGPSDGAAIQILIRPASPKWARAAHGFAKNLLTAKKPNKSTVLGSLKEAGRSVAGLDATDKAGSAPPADIAPTEIEQKASQLVEAKAASPAFEALIRLVVSTDNPAEAPMIVQDIVTSFAQFNLPGSNSLKFHQAKDTKKLATDFIFRFFSARHSSMVLSAIELATIFHLPSQTDQQGTPVERTGVKEVAAPTALAPKGQIFGSNFFRGTETVVRLADDDRRRHVYIVGQTGTGKSVTLENLIVQDMAAGKGLAFIDPHGDTAEKLLAKVPPARAEDVIYFNPGDTDRPLGLNLLEFDRPEQKDFIIQETINMLYKLYDPLGQGIIGPRYEQWYRNAALTIMSDPAGATFLEVPKVFTDNDYLKAKFKYVTDPIVQEFWTKEMAQTNDFHKSEMLGWFVAKFGAFATNDIMRNIIGQVESSFNIQAVMDEGKILIANLSKGLVGELNSKLLGMIFVIKFQAAAMARAGMAENQRRDFTLYVDEFQNFSTDSFATILSEARKYHLSLTVANQFIGQLNEQVRDAVFGNVGTIVSFRTGPQDADFLAKQFAPSFDSNDLVNLPNLHAAIRLMTAGVPSTPFSLKILFPPLGTPNPKLAEAITSLSRSKYGRAKEQVETEIYSYLDTKARTTTKPPEPITTPSAQ